MHSYHPSKYYPQFEIIGLLMELNTISVRGCLLLWTGADEYGLSQRGYKSTADSYANVASATPSVYVGDGTLAHPQRLLQLTSSPYRNPSSVYVVYQPAHIFDYCGRWQGGVVGSPVTMSYPSGALSSLQYQYNAPPATKAINFVDLPCPPSEVAKAYDPGAPYFPVLKTEFGVRYNPYTTADDPRVRMTTCEIAAVRDPPVRAVRVDAITGANDGSGIIP